MKKYAWSRHSDDEIWHGGVCDSVKECVEEARCEDYKYTDTFAIGYVEPYQVDCVNSDMIIEYLQENAYDEIGEVSESWLDSITREQREDLESRVLKVVLEWLKDCKEEPTFYKILPFDELTLQEALQKYDRSTDESEGETKCQKCGKSFIVIEGEESEDTE